MGCKMKYSGRELANLPTTKEKLFFVAIDMFAKKGYAATSVRDIADAVDIKPASIYNHFASKDAILDELIDFTGNAILAYYGRLSALIDAARSFDDMLDGIFKELETVVDIAVYYGVAILSSQQFNNPRAHETLVLLYMKHGIELLDRAFSMCIANGWTRAFDSAACARFVMNSVLTGVLARVSDDTGKSMAFDTTGMFVSLKLFLQNMLKA
jgi:AcrR family transcriptional regulator